MVVEEEVRCCGDDDDDDACPLSSLGSCFPGGGLDHGGSFCCHGAFSLGTETAG